MFQGTAIDHLGEEMIHRQVLQGRTNREVVIGVNRVYRDMTAWTCRQRWGEFQGYR